MGYLSRFGDTAVFFSRCSRLFSILLRADSPLIGWKWPPECQRVCSSLSCIDKPIIIFTLNGDLFVFPHLYYSLIVDDTTLAHLVENKTCNHGSNSSHQQPRQYGTLIGLSDWWTTHGTTSSCFLNGQMVCTALRLTDGKKKKKVGPLHILIKGHLIHPLSTSSTVDMTISGEIIKSGIDIWKPH